MAMFKGGHELVVDEEVAIDSGCGQRERSRRDMEANIEIDALRHARGRITHRALPLRRGIIMTGLYELHNISVDMIYEVSLLLIFCRATSLCGSLFFERCHRTTLLDHMLARRSSAKKSCQ